MKLSNVFAIEHHGVKATTK